MSHSNFQLATVKRPIHRSLDILDIDFIEEEMLVKETGEYGKIVGQPEYEIYSLDKEFQGFSYKDCVKIKDSL